MQNIQKNPYYKPKQELSLGDKQNQSQNFMSYAHEG